MGKAVSNYLPATSICAMALGVALWAPVSAQQSPAIGTVPGATPGAAASTIGQTISRSDLNEMLGKSGVSDRSELKGYLVRAQGPEGHPVLMLIGPEQMKGDTEVKDFSQDKLRGQLTAAGFQQIQFVSDPIMVRGALQDDKKLLAIGGQTGALPVAGVAQRDKPDLERFKSSLDTAGVQDRQEFKGKLLRGQGSGGQPVYLVVGPEDFKGDESVSLSAADLQKLQQGGLQNVELVQDVQIVRGKIGDNVVVALAGSDVAR